jgi:toxin ParE1/3/4
VVALTRTAKDRLASLLSSAHYKKRAVIAIDADAEQVSIIAMFYGGQDYETILQGDSEDGEEH